MTEVFVKHPLALLGFANHGAYKTPKSQSALYTNRKKYVSYQALESFPKACCRPQTFLGQQGSSFQIFDKTLRRCPALL